MTAEVSSSVRTPSRKRIREESPVTSQQKSGKIKKGGAGLRRSVRKKVSLETGGPELVNVSGRSIVKEVVLEEDWLRKEKVSDLVKLLNFQKWMHVFEVDNVDDDVVRVFYSRLSIRQGEDDELIGSAAVGGTVLTFTSKELAIMLEIPHEGYGDYTGRHWPEGVDGPAIMRRVSGDPSPGRSVTTQKMNLSTRLLHSFMVKSILPRSEKGSILQNQEAVIMDMVLKKKRVNLAKLIMGHMAHCRGQASHSLGYPTIIKRILQSSDAYRPFEEVICSRAMDNPTVKKMGFWYTPELGWIKDVGSSPSTELDLSSDSIKEILDRMEQNHSNLMQRFDQLSGQFYNYSQRNSNLLAEVVAYVRSVRASSQPSHAPPAP